MTRAEDLSRRALLLQPEDSEKMMLLLLDKEPMNKVQLDVTYAKNMQHWQETMACDLIHDE